MKIKFSIIVTIMALFFFGCQKETEVILDKEVSIILFGGAGNATETPLVHISNSIPYFDISNYSEIKSAKLVISDIKTFDENFEDVPGEGTFSLYDITNDRVIENSTIKSDDIPEHSFLSSDNFLSKLPKGKIKLGVQITGGTTFSAECRNISLVLTR